MTAAEAAEAPSTKIQAPMKFQTTNTDSRVVSVESWFMELGASLVLGAWCLELFKHVCRN
jgi:hypothetical protein